MARDEFSQPIKRALAERAGFSCSYPDCPAVTIGPSDENETSTSNTGEAAHIAAASGGRGARRYDPEMSPDQRSSIDNGIWLCNSHAKLIDTDASTYTVQMLKQWRALAERRAQLRQAVGSNFNRSDLVSIGLAPNYIPVLDTPEMNETIGRTVQLSWLADICGKEAAHTLRDFLIEYSRNAFSHGGATNISIEFRLNCVELSDDGAEFHLSQLHTGYSRGGGKALSAILQSRELGRISSNRTVDGINSVHIPFVLEPLDLPAVSPCAIALSREMVRTGSLDVARFDYCDRVYVVAPNFVCYSDGPLFERVLKQMIAEYPNVILILPESSSQVIAHFRALFPSIEVEAC